MTEHVKQPNTNNSGAGKAFCKVSACSYQAQCFLAFNGVLGGRELRVDFTSCNLSCVLCWAGNEENGCTVSSQDLAYRFLHCIKQKDAYLRAKYPDGVHNAQSFSTNSLQIIGGEPFLTRDRFLFIVDFLQTLNEKIEENHNYLTTNKAGQFKVKLFTNGLSIGAGTIHSEDLLLLTRLDLLDIRLLLSLKGLNVKNTDALQARKYRFNLLAMQTRALEILLSGKHQSLKVEPVLGFYHSSDYNIKAPGIDSSDMFLFSEHDEVSQKLKTLLSNFRASGGKIYVEPVHSVPQTQKGKLLFYSENSDFLEIEDLHESGLKGGSRRNLAETKIDRLL